MFRTTPILRGTGSHYNTHAGLPTVTVRNHASPLDLVKLGPLMDLSSGRAETKIALIDGPVATDHKDLSINLSAALLEPSGKGERGLEEAFDYAAKRGAIVVATAGNQRTVGSSAITRHPWVIPVAACDAQGRPISYSNLGNSIGRQGLSAPGYDIKSIGADGRSPVFSGTSAAAPFVTGAIALLKSIFPNATAAEVKLVVTRAHGSRRSTVVPPLLDAWAAYQVMATTHASRQVS